MAGKKGAIVQLQMEVNTDDDWQKLLQKQGLVVVDVYSEWCGPCVGMVGNLKKIKLDIGGDMLHLAIAKADSIESLERFRNKSEPIWMFIGSGHLVNLMFGANAPRLSKLIALELGKEAAVLKGEEERDVMPFDELTPEEKVRFDAAEKIRLSELAEKEAAYVRAKEFAHQKLVNTLTEELKDWTLVFYMPFNFNEDEGTWAGHLKLMEALMPHGFFVRDEIQIDIDTVMVSQMFPGFIKEIKNENNAHLTKGSSMVKLFEIKRKPVVPPESAGEGEQVPLPVPIEAEPDPMELMVTTIYAMPLCAPGEKQDIKQNCLAKQFGKSNIPGMWTPANKRFKAEIVARLFPKFAQQFIESDPEPLPPHLALAFKAFMLEEMSDTLVEHQNDILEFGIFEQTSPDSICQIGTTPEDYYNLPNKSGKERLVMMLDATDNDVLLTFSQFMPVYVSPNAEVGISDYKFFFPQRFQSDPVESLDCFPYTLMTNAQKNAAMPGTLVDGTDTSEEKDGKQTVATSVSDPI